MKRKKRIEKLEEQQPELDPKKALISCGTSWLNAVKDGNYETAIKAREKAEKYFNDFPQYLEETPFCEKMLYIHWQWFCRYLNPQAREFFNKIFSEGKMPSAYGNPDDF